MALKSLFSRKKKSAPEGDEEPFFTGATLGPGLDDGPADAIDTTGNPAEGAAAGGQPRGFADILDDDDWGDDLAEDDALLGHGQRKRKRLAMLAGIGVVAAVLAGGAAWWVMTDGDISQPPAMAEDASPAPTPTAPIASGPKVSLPMPAVPGLEDTIASKADTTGQRSGGSAVLDPTAATDKSVVRRPWLAQDSATSPADTAAGDQTAESEGKAPAPEETETAQASADMAEATPPTAPQAPKIEEPEYPNTRVKRPTPSFDKLAAAPEAEPLREAPVDDLTRKTPAGPMPIPAPDGRKAWTTYAKPFQAPAGTPLIAVVVADLGMLPAATTAAIEKLPADVTLAFSPYGFDVPQAMNQAREAGHEVMLTLPMEGRGFPANDPGPLGLNTMLPVNDNLIRLNTVMTKGIGYTGLLGRDGAALTANQEIMGPVLEAIGRAGLLYVQPASGMQLVNATGPSDMAPPTARVDLKLDERPFREAIEARLAVLEEIARQKGTAIAVVDPTPLAFDAVSKWLKTLQGKGLALAPCPRLSGREFLTLFPQQTERPT